MATNDFEYATNRGHTRRRVLLVENWDQFVSEHAETVYRTAYRMLHDSGEAEDVMQEVLLEIFRGGVEGKRGRLSDLPLVRRMATLRAIDRLRKRVAHEDLSGDVPGKTEHLPDRTAASREQMQILQRAIGELPERDAECFALRYLEGLDNNEIASALGIGVSAVSTSLGRARQRLRASRLVQASLGEET